MFESAHDVVFLDELDERVEPGDTKGKGPGEVGAYRSDDVGSENVGEPKEAHDCRGVVLGKVADELLDLDEGPFDPGPRCPGADRVLGEPCGVGLASRRTPESRT